MKIAADEWRNRTRPFSKLMMRRFIFSFLFFALLASTGSRAHMAVPPQVLDPKTPAEAWNVIRLSVANVARLIEEKRLSEVAVQISFCSPALRLLARSPTAPDHAQRVNDGTALAFRNINDIAVASMADQQQETEVRVARLRETLDGLKPAFDPATVSAEIHVCPVHPDFMVAEAGRLCEQCHGPLRIRRIPYSDIYVKPGAPNAALSVQAKSVVVAGTPMDVTARLAGTDGQPFKSADLIRSDSAQVCMLIADAKFEDFQAVVPTAGEKEGEWLFRFTPATAGPYRMWADITPASTALPESPWADLGGDFGRSIQNGVARADSLTATVEGLKFELSFHGGNGGAPPAQQARLLRIHITDASGRDVTTLQPLMNAFAHLTGIYDDGETVVRYHPTGGEILIEVASGGPWVAFKVYFPKPGYVRFFCRFRLNDRVITVPFAVNIAR